MKMKHFWYGFYTLLFLLFVGAVAFKVFQPVQVLPRIRLAPGFLLYDHRGQPLSNEDLRGKVVLYGFWYSHCPNPCHNILPTMIYVAKHLPEQPQWRSGDVDIAFVVISLDPERDTPAVLAPYAERLAQETGQTWYFATHPDPKRLKIIVGGGFEVYYQKREDGLVDFEPTYFIVDGWGIIRGEYAYESLAPTTERLLRHLNVLAEEIHNSRGAAKAAYEAAHLFLCYAR